MAYFDIGYPHAKVKRVVGENYRTIENRLSAWRLDHEYYDGRRENGYGGFVYDGRWAAMLPALVRRYGITASSRVLEVGCKKGFFLHDLKEALPGITVRGIENHPYPLAHCMDSVKGELSLAAYEHLPFDDNSFDFVMAYAAIYMLNLGGVVQALREIERVSKGKSYVTLGAYKTMADRERLAQWTLIGTTILREDEWLQVFATAGYSGDYYFTTADSLNLVKA